MTDNKICSAELTVLSGVSVHCFTEAGRGGSVFRLASEVFDLSRRSVRMKNRFDILEERRR